MHGLAGKILKVDLSSGGIETGPTPEDLFRDFFGGAGAAARWFFDNADLEVDPLSPENPLMIFTGLLSSSGIPGTSRFSVCAKSPLTGIWGESSCGGSFAPELQAAGFDAVIFTGSSARPVVLLIEDGQARLDDAAWLWGKDSYQTVDEIKAREGAKGGRGPKVLCIGQAGENLVRLASVCHDKHDYAGRCGLGAVMGSKRLKAIACRGSGKVEPYDKQKLDELRRRLYQRIKDSVPADSLRQMGTNSSMDLGMMTGDVPIKGWMVGEALELSAAIGGPAMSERFLKKAAACRFCTIGCRRVMQNDSEPYRLQLGPGPEYETVASLGALCFNSDAASILKANELCNRYGMDTIAVGHLVALVMECFEKGILTTQQLEGIEARWGNPEAILALIRKIAHREGIGYVLAEGSREAARRIGHGAEKLTAEVKGLDIPMHDPRAFHGLGLAYMMSNRGACHNAHLVHPIEQGIATWTDIGFSENYNGQSAEGKGELVRRAEDFGVPCGALSLCVFTMWTYGSAHPAEALRAMCGLEISLDEYLKTGERIWLLKRAINNLMGVTVADDRLPEKVLRPVKEGGAAGSVPDHERLRRDYYVARGLDERGWPRREVLEAAGLSDVAERLYPNSKTRKSHH